VPFAAVPVAATPDQIVYTPQLPRVVDLTNAAAAQRLTINQIVQTASGITVSYELANGQTRTVSYQLLLAENTTPVQTVIPTSAPVVVVAPLSGVYYYDPYFYYGPWYPPIALRFGANFGFRGRWR
jgi:hypothetical protein